MGFLKDLFGVPAPPPSELVGVAISDIEDIFVIAQTEPLMAHLAGKNQQEKMIAAVNLAYALWNEKSVREWSDLKSKLVSLAGSGNPVTKTVALDCVRRNFPATQYSAFAVTCATVQGLGQVALVLGLSREPFGS